MSNAATAPQGATSRPDRDAARWRLGASAVLAVSAALLFGRLGARAIWTMEVRWAEIAREMALSGDYFWPTIGQKPYYDKPLGSYWLIVAASWFTDGVTELAARLPSAVAGFVAVALVMALARRLYDSRTSVWAGLILTTSFSFVYFARCASADMETLAGVLAASVLFILYEDHQSKWLLFGMWITMALTSLTKGLVGFALPIAIISTYSCFADGWPALRDALTIGPLRARLRWLVERNRWLFNASSLAGIAIAMTLYAAPFVVSGISHEWERGVGRVVRENFLRFFNPFDHRAPVYLYAYAIFALAAPWSVLLPASLSEIHHRRRVGVEPARADRFALAYFWVTFIFFTLSGSRRSYYLVPILPAVALIVAAVLARPGGQLSPRAWRLLRWGFALAAILSVGAVVALLPPEALLSGDAALLPPIPARGIYAVIWLAIVATFIWSWWRIDTRRVGIAFAVLATLGLAYVFLVAIPASETYRTEKPFAAAVRRHLAGHFAGLAILGAQAPVYYLHEPFAYSYFIARSKLLDAVRGGKVKYIIVSQRELSKLGFPVEVLVTEESFAWESKSTRKGKVSLVRVVALPTDPAPESEDGEGDE
ncbi:MAG: ArnT family glycosyltransferase [Candidatus Binataceae bacterium]